MKKKSSAVKVKKKAPVYARIPGLWIMNTSGVLKIDHEDILYCHHGNDVTKIFYLSGRLTKAHIPLIKLEQKLCRKKFYRCHRNYLINLNYAVGAVQDNDTLRLPSLCSIPVARRKKNQLLLKLEKVASDQNRSA